jgi:hypothetical protein
MYLIVKHWFSESFRCTTQEAGSVTVDKNTAKISLLNLSIEEENLAAIPFAVLERRVGKRYNKIEIKGSKVLPDGTDVRVVWQVQGNSELGLPTEQDLDIFVALGVLTFRSNFAKTISFTGREIAKILNIGSVHGKFYQRLKLAMDRFIPLRFRSLTESDSQEEVKWSNVFQEASFALDRVTNRCTGVVTWTDKLIQSMDNGFFRAIDAGRYMQLDGITAKYLYRFLAMAFETTDMVVIDARQLANEHLGIPNIPKYFSRLMQTLEPALDQLIRIGVLGVYHIVSSEGWTIALHRHADYVPERKTLLIQGTSNSPEINRAFCQKALEHGGFAAKQAAAYAEAGETPELFYRLNRAAQLIAAMKEEGVLPYAAVETVRRALDCNLLSQQGLDQLDCCEIAVELCRQRKRAGHGLRNPAGLLMKVLKDPDTRRRLVNNDMEASLRQRFRQKEQAAIRQHREAEQRTEILGYEEYCIEAAQKLLQEMPAGAKAALRKEKAEVLRQQQRFDRISSELRDREIDELMLREVIEREIAPFEKWLLRKRVQQSVLPFMTEDHSVSATPPDA